MGVVVVFVEEGPFPAALSVSTADAISLLRALSCAAASSNFARSLATLICRQTNTRFFTWAQLAVGCQTTVGKEVDVLDVEDQRVEHSLRRLRAGEFESVTNAS